MFSLVSQMFCGLPMPCDGTPVSPASPPPPPAAPPTSPVPPKHYARFRIPHPVDSTEKCPYPLVEIYCYRIDKVLWYKESDVIQLFQWVSDGEFLVKLLSAEDRKVLSDGTAVLSFAGIWRIVSDFKWGESVCVTILKAVPTLERCAKLKQKHVSNPLAYCPLLRKC